jgi:hypothetical protein
LRGAAPVLFDATSRSGYMWRALMLRGECPRRRNFSRTTGHGTSGVE